MKMMNRAIIFVLCTPLLITYSVSAQDISTNPCYFDEYTNNQSILEAEEIIQNGVEKLKYLKFDNKAVNNSANEDVKIIPVVVHVLHTGGAENISDEQIESQIKIMNEDYGKIEGSNGDGAGVDTKVRFCLAKIDPNGNCTNGIVRIYTSLTNHRTYERAMLKQLSFWDNEKYMNIYLVKSISGGTLGYSSFPGGPPDEDGMVVKSSVFGNIGTASSSLGRTASHEIGHWFGLYHTFQNGCGDDVCTGGDYVCDTPPQALPSFNCETLNTCSNDVPDLDDQKENYMNYTPDACKNMFTNGQKLRLQSTLENIRTVIWSEENLVATGCDEDYTAPEICGVVPSFATLTPQICVDGTVAFVDVSLNNPVSWNWTFEGGTPSSSTLANPEVVYKELGSYRVKLVVSNGESTDSITIENYINVSTPGIGESLPFYEDFESGEFPPKGIIIKNADGGITWNLDSAAAKSGKYSIKINNLINTNYGSSDEIIFPFFDLATHPEANLYMTFDWAYAKSDQQFSDEMIVQLSTDCGSNFKRIYYRSGNGLATGPVQTTPFVPDSSQWKKATINISPYLEERYVQIKIVNITDGGNNLYIDNINIGEPPAGVEYSNNGNNDNLMIYPNPASEKINLEFLDNIENRIIKIYNSFGEELFSKNIGRNRVTSISTENFNSGIYYLEIIENNNSRTRKLIISK
jgi:PKD repeat protein